MEMSALLSVWWVWLAFGGLLLIFELLVPAFIFLGFALGAGFTAVIVAMATPSTPMKFLIFAIASVLAWGVLRWLIPPAPKSVKRFENDIND